MYRYLLLLIFAISHFSLKHFFVETLDKDETCHVGFVGYWDQTLHDLADRVPGLMLQGSLILGLIILTEGIEGWIQKVWELTTFIARSLGFKRVGGWEGQGTILPGQGRPLCSDAAWLYGLGRQPALTTCRWCQGSASSSSSSTSSRSTLSRLAYPFTIWCCTTLQWLFL